MKSSPKMNPWTPMKDPVDLKHLGKLIEELGECTSAASRCIIQGVDEREPVTDKANRRWLAEELADVLAGVELCIEHFNLDVGFIALRKAGKKQQLRSWHQ